MILVLALTPIERWTKTRVHVYEGKVAIQFDVKYDVATAPVVAPEAILVKSAGSKGRGAFASVRIPAGTFLGSYKGEELDFDQFTERYRDSTPEYVVRIDSNLYLDGREARRSDSFTPALINHGKPNVVRYCRQRRPPIVDFFVDAHIEPGEELLMDYGMQYWLGRFDLDAQWLDPDDDRDQGAVKNWLKAAYKKNPSNFEALYVATLFSFLVFVGQVAVRYVKNAQTENLADILDLYT